MSARDGCRTIIIVVCILPWLCQEILGRREGQNDSRLRGTILGQKDLGYFCSPLTLYDIAKVQYKYGALSVQKVFDTPPKIEGRGA